MELDDSNRFARIMEIREKLEKYRIIVKELENELANLLSFDNIKEEGLQIITFSEDITESSLTIYEANDPSSLSPICTSVSDKLECSENSYVRNQDCSIVCLLCNASCTNMTSHLQNHLVAVQITCQFCDAHFKIEMEFYIHACSNAKQNKLCKSNLIFIVNVFGGCKFLPLDIINLVQNICGEHSHKDTDEFLSFMSQDGFYNHMYSTNNSLDRLKGYKCYKCDRVYKSSKALNLHVRLRHSTESSTDAQNCQFTCHVCGRQFHLKAHLTLHLVNNHKQKESFKCQTCGKVCSSKYNLKSHLLTHTRVRSFTCEFCGKDFIRKCDLERHRCTNESHNEVRRQILLRRNEKKPPLCKICGKLLSSNDKLKIHLKIHASERPFGCDTCQKRFNSVEMLRRHVLVRHSETKAFSCHVCGKCFALKGMLASHMYSHSKSPGYKCEICGKEFRHPLARYSHRAVHNGPKTYSCGVCQQIFSKRELLIEHQRIHNNLNN